MKTTTKQSTKPSDKTDKGSKSIKGPVKPTPKHTRGEKSNKDPNKVKNSESTISNGKQTKENKSKGNKDSQGVKGSKDKDKNGKDNKNDKEEKDSPSPKEMPSTINKSTPSSTKQTTTTAKGIYHKKIYS